MKNERFSLTHLPYLMWQVSDAETGFSIKFREGLFNETQEVSKPQALPEGVNGDNIAQWAAYAMSAIGDYMAAEHPYIATCDMEARRAAIWILSHESWWVTLAAACNSLLVDFEEGDLAEQLCIEVEDFFTADGSNPGNLSENEQHNLIGALSLLDEDEAAEVFAIIHTFWHEYYDAEADTQQWARDLLWWPAFANPIIDNLDEEKDGDN